MVRITIALAGAFVLGGAPAPRATFAEITAVDAKKNEITYTITFGKDRQTQVLARLNKDCAIKEGYYRLGKPASTVEKEELPGGLQHAAFAKASAENPVVANVYVAQADDDGKGYKKGEVIKILVNPMPKKKKSI